MLTSWQTWLCAYPRLELSIFLIRPLYSGTPNHSLVSKLPTMVVNTPSLAFVLTILLTFVIPYSILASLSRRLMGQMLHSYLVINYWLSIRIPFLLVNSNAILTLLTTIALGKPRQRELSSFCTWMVIRILLVLWPRDAHITPGYPSLSLIYFDVTWNSSKSKFFPRGVKTVHQCPLSLKIRALHNSPSSLIFGIL